LFHAAFDVAAAVLDVAEDWVRVRLGGKKGIRVETNVFERDRRRRLLRRRL
jgi:hypothetical protein